MFRYLLLICCILSFSLAAIPGSGAEKGVTGLNRQLPIQVKSDELTADNNKRSATFIGNVVATQGDLTLFADKLVITYGEQGKELVRAEAFNNVRFVHGARKGEAAHGVYDLAKGTIVLDGRPKIIQGENLISGEVITYYPNEERSTVSGGQGGRVEAVIQPREQKKSGSSPP